MLTLVTMHCTQTGLLLLGNLTGRVQISRFCEEHGSTVFTFIFQFCSKYNTQAEPNWKYLSGINCCIINFSISFSDPESEKSLQKVDEEEAVAAYIVVK